MFLVGFPRACATSRSHSDDVHSGEDNDESWKHRGYEKVQSGPEVLAKRFTVKTAQLRKLAPEDVIESILLLQSIGPEEVSVSNDRQQEDEEQGVLGALCRRELVNLERVPGVQAGLR